MTIHGKVAGEVNKLAKQYEAIKGDMAKVSPLTQEVLGAAMVAILNKMCGSISSLPPEAQLGWVTTLAESGINLHLAQAFYLLGK